MKQTVLAHIELNEKYHDSKEKMAWTGASLYLIFAFATIKWLLNESSSLDPLETPIAIIVLVTVLLGALAFTSFQFRHRWQSTCKAAALKEVLRYCDCNSNHGNFVAMSDAAQNVEKGRPKNRRRPFFIAYMTVIFPISVLLFFFDSPAFGQEIFDSRYKTEVPTYGLMVYLAAAQVVLVVSG